MGNTHMTELLRLATNGLELVVAPETGGSVARFDCTIGSDRHPVLRGTRGVPKSPLEATSFPLVPYCNRIRDGRFTFRGRMVHIDVNAPPDPNPLHGQGWLMPWTIKAAGQTNATLHLQHPAGEWPWTYEAHQHFTLGEDALDLVLTCRNLDSEPMPCGLGQHPYFPCTPDTRLDAPVDTAWTIDAKVLPVEQVPARGRYDLRDRLVCGQGLDNGFGGWTGKARMTTPDVPFVTIMSSPDARFFQLYSPKEGGLYVAEPVTHANAALNEDEADWVRLGLRVLEPGEVMTLRMRIAVMLT